MEGGAGHHRVPTNIRWVRFQVLYFTPGEAAFKTLKYAHCLACLPGQLYLADTAPELVMISDYHCVAES